MTVSPILAQQPIQITLSDGSVLKGVTKQENLQLSGLFGDVSVPLSEVTDIQIGKLAKPTPKTPKITVSPTKKPPVKVPASPTKEVSFSSDFEGHPFELWKTGWAIKDGRLASQRNARPGFTYGHWGHGRGGCAITGIGDEKMTDYEIEFDFEMQPANRQFYPHHIPGETRGMSVILRAQEVSESWNEPDTYYIVGVNPAGGWGITKRVGFHYPVARGWSSNREGTTVALGSGKGTGPLKEGTNRIRVRVEGNKIAIWMNGEPLGEALDDDPEKFGGKPISFGGWGVQWRYESMGWFNNINVLEL